MSSPPTTLPSIQFLLTKQTSEDKKFTRGHRSTRSVSSLPSELQNLSLNGPNISHPPPAPSKDDSHLIRPQPSWMTGPPPVQSSLMISSNNSNNNGSSLYTMDQTSSSSQQRPTNTNHQRSISDLSMTTPPTNSIQTGFIPTMKPNSHIHQHLQQYQPHQHRLHHNPLHQQQRQHHHHQRHLSHRRAISATTVDHMMQPSSSSSSSINAPPVPPLPFYHRAHSNSPPEDYLSLNTTKPQPLDTFMDRPRTKQEQAIFSSSSSPSTTTSTTTTTITAATTTPPSTQTSIPATPEPTVASYTTVNGMELPRDAATGRYLCPYCQKAFSRPSSLRIHTYSHTGEKPFVCSECPRRFSVQSNMRRHLRIHLIRPSNKTAF